ncbi:MAG: hypothetical protein IJB21_02520 [Bacilli bacterium]|nr:hypothetical protein [Bacilli bacterium]
MKKITEKTFIITTGLIIGILALVTSLLVKYGVILELYEFPIFVTLFTLGSIMSAIVDKLYFKSNWTKKQTIGMIIFCVIVIIGTILAWIFK